MGGDRPRRRPPPRARLTRPSSRARRGLRRPPAPLARPPVHLRAATGARRRGRLARRRCRSTGERSAGGCSGATDDVPGADVAGSSSASRRCVLRRSDGSRCCRWVSERYVAPLAAVIGACAPPACRVRGGADRRPPNAAGGREPVDARDPRELAADGVPERADSLRAGLARHAGCFVVRPGPRGRGRRRRGGGAPDVAGGPPSARARARGRSGSRDGHAGCSRRSGSARRCSSGGDQARAVPTVARDRRRGATTSWSARAPRCSRRSPTSGSCYVVARVAPRTPRGPRALLPRARRRAGSSADRRARPACCPRSARPSESQRRDCRAGGALAPSVAAGRGRASGTRGTRAAARAMRSAGRRGGSCSRRFPATGSRRSAGTCGAARGVRGVRRGAARGAGAVRCVVCEPPGRCAACGATQVRSAPRRRRTRGGVGRPVAPVPVDPPIAAAAAGLAEHDGILVGGPESVRDLGPLDLDLVAILDADLAARRPGVSAIERALATWMEAVAWAGSHGRAIVQSSTPNDPAVQAVVRGSPDRFHRDEVDRRREAGFPVGAPVFRVAGTVGSRRRAPRAPADHVPDIDRWGADGMLARARPRRRAGVRRTGSRAGGAWCRRPRRGRTPPVGESHVDHADPHPGGSRAAGAARSPSSASTVRCADWPTTCSRRCTTRRASDSPARRSACRSRLFVYDDGEDRAGVPREPGAVRCSRASSIARRGMPVDPRAVPPHGARGPRAHPWTDLKGRPVEHGRGGAAGADLPARDRPPGRALYIDRLDEEGRKRSCRQLRQIELQRAMQEQAGS